MKPPYDTLFCVVCWPAEFEANQSKTV